MTEKKILNEEELDKVAGGLVYDSVNQVVFQYEKGYTMEICDHRGLFHNFTHRAKIVHRGCAKNDFGKYFVVYYFEGVNGPEPDVDGWYNENEVKDLEKNNLTNCRVNSANVIIID